MLKSNLFSNAGNMESNGLCGNIKKFDNIIKPKIDNRIYRGLIMENNLKVLLISDPLTDKSAASLNLNIGSNSNPKEVQGLAHFLEHMLFLGTEKV